MKKTDIIIATKSCKGCPFKLHADRSSYCQAETLFPSSYLSYVVTIYTIPTGDTTSINCL